MADHKPKTPVTRPADTGIWHSVRRSLARHHVGEFLKTMVVVAPLTVLIWIYAERSQVTDETHQVAIDFRSADPAKLAAIITDRTPLVLDLKGSRSQISRMKEDFARRAASGQLIATLPSNYSQPGDVTIDMATLLNSDPTFNNYGVAITKVTPSIARVKLDPYKDVQLTVVLPPDIDGIQQVVFDPPKVIAHGPQTELSELRAEIAVDKASIQQLARQPGQQSTDIVPLVLPASGLISIRPPRVSVSFEVSSDKPGNIPAVPISIQQPVTFTNRWTVLIKGQLTVTNVRVQGPAKAVDLLLPNGNDEPKVKLTAVLVVKQEDAGKTVRRAVEFQGLPPNVKVISTDHEVEFEVRSDPR